MIDIKVDKFSDIFADWVENEKRGTIREVTLSKYLFSAKNLRKIAPDITLAELNKKTYQEIINEYAKTHERGTVLDFHTQLKSCLMDLFESRIIDRNPATRITITGKQVPKKPEKFISLQELGDLISLLDLSSIETRDWPILLLAKTGMRFAEMLALRPMDFDFENLTVTIDKTWDYKFGTGFIPTKNRSSIRVIDIDWQIAAQMQPLVIGKQPEELLFVHKDENGNYKRVHNSTFNDYLKKKCREAGVREISIHGLRHTHGSILLSQGVSILSVSKRLGHANVTTTQEVYLHITDELARKDKQLVMGALAGVR